MTAGATDAVSGIAPSFAAGAREDFRDAIARHRRTAWRVTAACAVAYLVLGLTIAELMAPLIYCVVGLALDVVNLLTPLPDLLGSSGRAVDEVFLSGRPLALGPALGIAIIAAAPGLALYGAAMFAVRRALLMSPMFERGPTRGDALGRGPNPSRLAEIQIVDTIEEMAVAALIPAPRVVFVEDSLNAASFGMDVDNATVMIGAGMARALTRPQMQGVAAHLVASIADGDMKIGMRTALTLGAFALITLVNTGWNDRARRAATSRLVRALVTPTQKNLAWVLSRLSDPFSQPEETSRAQEEGTTSSWRDGVQLPFMGPLLLSGFLSGLVSGMLLSPLLSVAWRQRKYAADAIAVQLTRDPNALDQALEAIAGAGPPAGLPSWAGHLCIVNPGKGAGAGLIGGDMVPIFPSIDRRRRELVRMGAQDDPTLRRRQMPLWALAIVILLGAVLFALMATVVFLLLAVSAALTGMFTILPALLLHHLLR